MLFWYHTSLWWSLVDSLSSTWNWPSDNIIGLAVWPYGSASVQPSKVNHISRILIQRKWICFILIWRSGIRYLHHRPLHGNVLQHDHRLGRLLLFRFVHHRRFAVDVLWPSLEHQQLRSCRSGCQWNSSNQSSSRIFRVSKNTKQEISIHHRTETGF